MASNEVLIIFVRNPVLGKVKTRLAKSIGNQEALNIYLQLLEHTHKVTASLACDKFLFYSDYINLQDLLMVNKKKSVLFPHKPINY